MLILDCIHTFYYMICFLFKKNIIDFLIRLYHLYTASALVSLAKTGFFDELIRYLIGRRIKEIQKLTFRAKALVRAS